MDEPHDRAVPATEEQLSRLAEIASDLGMPWADRLGEARVAVAHGYVPDFPEWEVLTVAERGEAHPVLTSVALPRSGARHGLVLDGRAETWDQLVVGATVTAPERARACAERYLHFIAAGRRVTVVDSVGDIPWLEPWSEASRVVLDEGRSVAEGAVHRVEVSAVHEGWQVRMMAVEQDRLVAHDLVIGRDGRLVRDEPRVVATGLLVPVAT